MPPLKTQPAGVIAVLEKRVVHDWVKSLNLGGQPSSESPKGHLRDESGLGSTENPASPSSR